MRIALVHALKHSIVPIEASFAKLWPEARLMNLLDDSLSADLASDGKLTDVITARFLAIGDYAASTGVSRRPCSAGLPRSSPSPAMARSGISLR